GTRAGVACVPTVDGIRGRSRTPAPRRRRPAGRIAARARTARDRGVRRRRTGGAGRDRAIRLRGARRAPQGWQRAATSPGDRGATGSIVTIDEAYRHCEDVTRLRAGNFYHGIRLLPAPRRAALCAVYALARKVDDIADGPLPDDDKLRLLDAVRADVGALGTVGDDPVFVA